MLAEKKRIRHTNNVSHSDVLEHLLDPKTSLKVTRRFGFYTKPLVDFNLYIELYKSKYNEYELDAVYKDIENITAKFEELTTLVGNFKSFTREFILLFFSEILASLKSETFDTLFGVEKLTKLRNLKQHKQKSPFDDEVDYFLNYVFEKVLTSKNKTIDFEKYDDDTYCFELFSDIFGYVCSKVGQVFNLVRTSSYFNTKSIKKLLIGLIEKYIDGLSDQYEGLETDFNKFNSRICDLKLTGDHVLYDPISNSLKINLAKYEQIELDIFNEKLDHASTYMDKFKSFFDKDYLENKIFLLDKPQQKIEKIEYVKFYIDTETNTVENIYIKFYSRIEIEQESISKSLITFFDLLSLNSKRLKSDPTKSKFLRKFDIGTRVTFNFDTYNFSLKTKQGEVVETNLAELDEHWNIKKQLDYSINKIRTLRQRLVGKNIGSKAYRNLLMKIFFIEKNMKSKLFNFANDLSNLLCITIEMKFKGCNQFLTEVEKQGLKLDGYTLQPNFYCFTDSLIVKTMLNFVWEVVDHRNKIKKLVNDQNIPVFGHTLRKINHKKKYIGNINSKLERTPFSGYCWDNGILSQERLNLLSLPEAFQQRIYNYEFTVESVKRFLQDPKNPKNVLIRVSDMDYNFKEQLKLSSIDDTKLNSDSTLDYSSCSVNDLDCDEDSEDCNENDDSYY